MPNSFRKIYYPNNIRTHITSILSEPVVSLLGVIPAVITVIFGILFISTFTNALAEPVVNDPELEVQTVFAGLEFPTGIAFLGPNDILVLEKNQGAVMRIINGQMLEEPVLDVNVANQVERGILGIAVGTPDQGHTYVYLFYTEAEEVDNGQPLGNRVYRYEFTNGKLINPTLLLDLPYLPGPAHNAGIINIGPDGNVYVITGNLFSPDINEDDEEIMTQAENFREGIDPDGRTGILRATKDGEPVLDSNGKGILGDSHPLNMYYAYGIRNSFGFTFDPVTGKLWDTENGGLDEINLVEPGFNSGWQIISGRANLDDDLVTSELVDFNGKGKYSDPEFTWYEDSIGDVAPTGIVFLNSSKLGEQYENDMFVGDWHIGNIYRFDLNQNRTMLDLQGPLSDKKADTPEEADGVLFGEGFSGVVDLEVGPDGYLYILSLGEGTIYRIVPLSGNAI
jgi:glucose/arabinose dehydrogenase